MTQTIESRMISEATIDDVTARISSITPKQADELVHQMSVEQPFVLAYLIVHSEYEDFDEQESELFLFVGVTLWQIMKQRANGCPMVSDQALIASEKANEDALEKLAADSSGDFLGATGNMLERYPEPEVLRYLTEVLVEANDEETPLMREENLGYAFLYLKVMLDALVEA